MTHIRQQVMLATSAVAAASSAGHAQSALDGFYGGVSYGQFTSETDSYGSYFGTKALAGVYAGYDYNLGNLFVGGEVAYSFGSLTDDDYGTDADSFLDVKVRLGRDFDAVKVYGFVGASRYDNEYMGATESGRNYGFGASMDISPRMDMGLEYIKRDFGSPSSEYSDVRGLSTVSLRLGFKF